MTRPLTRPERLGFGEDAELHPITDMPLQRGYGALPADQQAVVDHLNFFKTTREQAAGRLADFDRAIADINTDPRQIEGLQRRRNATADEVAALDKRIGQIEIAFLKNGLLEKYRGKEYADAVRRRMSVVA